MEIRYELTKTPKQRPTDESKLGFAKQFSDHMFVMDYTEGQGWHDARIVPYQSFSGPGHRGLPLRPGDF